MTDTPETPEGAAPAPAPKAAPAPEAAAPAAAPAAAKAEGAASGAAKDAGSFLSRYWNRAKRNFELVEGNKGKVAFRSAGVLLGATMTAHSLKSKTDDGEDRSVALRLVEGITGVGLAGASVLAGGR